MTEVERMLLIVLSYGLLTSIRLAILFDKETRKNNISPDQNSVNEEENS